MSRTKQGTRYEYVFITLTKKEMDILQLEGKLTAEPSVLTKREAVFYKELFRQVKGFNPANIDKKGFHKIVHRDNVEEEIITFDHFHFVKPNDTIGLILKVPSSKILKVQEESFSDALYNLESCEYTIEELPNIIEDLGILDLATEEYKRGIGIITDIYRSWIVNVYQLEHIRTMYNVYINKCAVPVKNIETKQHTVVTQSISDILHEEYTIIETDDLNEVLFRIRFMKPTGAHLFRTSKGESIAFNRDSLPLTIDFNTEEYIKGNKDIDTIPVSRDNFVYGMLEVNNIMASKKPVMVKSDCLDFIVTEPLTISEICRLHSFQEIVLSVYEEKTKKKKGEKKKKSKKK